MWSLINKYSRVLFFSINFSLLQVQRSAVLIIVVPLYTSIAIVLCKNAMIMKMRMKIPPAGQRVRDSDGVSEDSEEWCGPRFCCVLWAGLGARLNSSGAKSREVFPYPL